MFVTRLISGIVLVAVALLTICSGGWILYGTLTIVSLIGMFELYRAVKVQKQGENLLAVVGYLGVILHYILLSLGYSEYAMMNLIIVLIAMMFVYVFSYPKYHAEQVMAAFFSVVYVGVMLSYIYQTRMIRDGAFLVWLIFLCSWGCDTCAYCVGMLIGKHKMSPVLSPKKSVEGAGGGVQAADPVGGGEPRPDGVLLQHVLPQLVGQQGEHPVARVGQGGGDVLLPVGVGAGDGPVLHLGGAGAGPGAVKEVGHALNGGGEHHGLVYRARREGAGEKAVEVHPVVGVVPLHLL